MTQGAASNTNISKLHNEDVQELQTAQNIIRVIQSRSVLLTEYCAGGKMENNEMGRACGAYGGGEKGAQGSGGET